MTCGWHVTDVMTCGWHVSDKPATHVWHVLDIWLICGEYVAQVCKMTCVLSEKVTTRGTIITSKDTFIKDLEKFYLKLTFSCILPNSQGPAGASWNDFLFNNWMSWISTQPTLFLTFSFLIKIPGLPDSFITALQLWLQCRALYLTWLIFTYQVTVEL